MKDKQFKLDWIFLPLFGAAVVLVLWSVSSATWARELPSPFKTWERSKDYVLKPFAKRGDMDQGILRFTWYLIVLVAKGYVIMQLLGTPYEFLLYLFKAS